MSETSAATGSTGLISPQPARPTALVTGASAGIGEAIARELAARGNDVVVVARDAARLDTLARELSASYGVEAEVLVADLIDPSQLAKVEARVSDPERPIDVLVNNAGFGTAGDFSTLDVSREESEIRLNVVALTRLTHAALGPMLDRGRGGILNVASLASFQPTAHMAVYGATKAFVSSFTQAVHEEVRGTGVHVTALCPGFTRTEFQERSGATANRVPDMAWQDAPEVARAGLDALARNTSVAVPGAMNKVAAVMSDISPTVITRRVAALLGKYYET
jgi:short-subunit dehydrogenase